MGISRALRVKPGTFPGAPAFSTPAGDYNAQTLLSDGAITYNAFPSYCKLNNKIRWVTWYKAASHQGNKGKVVGRRSLDAGVTWENEEVTLWDDPGSSIDVRGGWMTLLSTGQLSMTTEIAPFDSGGVIHSPDGVWIRYFDVDFVTGDLTFDRDVHVTDSYTVYSLTADPLLEYPDGGGPGNMGTLILPFYGISTSGDQVTSVKRSTDGGDTWGADIEVYAVAGLNMGETSLVTCKDGLGPGGAGSILALIRDNTNSQIKRRRSVDGGLTWTSVATGVTPAGRANPNAIVHESGRITFVTRRGPLATGDGMPLLYSSTDHGATFNTLGKPVENGPWIYMDYGDMEEGPTGTIGLVVSLEQDSADTNNNAQVIHRWLMERPGITPDYNVIVPSVVAEENKSSKVVASGVGRKGLQTDGFSIANNSSVIRTTSASISPALPFVLCDPGSGNIDQTLGASRNSKGIDIIVVHFGTAGTVTVKRTGTTTIDGLAQDITLLPGQSVRLRSDENPLTSNYISNLDKKPACRLYHSVNQTTATGTTLWLDWDTERYDTDGIHSLVTNIKRLTFPVPGIWGIGAQVEMASNATGSRTMDVRANGTDTIARETKAAPATGSSRLNIYTEDTFALGEYVEIGVNQSSGGNLDVTASVSPFRYSPRVFAHLVRKLG